MIGGMLPPAISKTPDTTILSSAFAANLFPLADGNSWTYRDAATGDAFRVRVGTPSIISDKTLCLKSCQVRMRTV